LTKERADRCRNGAPQGEARPRREDVQVEEERQSIPTPIVNRYGADAARWFMLSDSPPERDLEWSEAGIEGAARFVQRIVAA
jgi:leucyl-tRNA synthetase